MTQPHSHVAKVFKGFYFPMCNFLEPLTPSQHSSVWKALVAGCTVLEACCFLRIANGMLVSVWEDRWLPVPPASSPHAAELSFSEYASFRYYWLVFDGLENARNWCSFHLKDAVVIKGIPLTPRSLEDIFTWRMVDNGIFTVRSSYYISYSHLHKKDPYSIIDLWKWLLDLKMPPRVQLKFWRACDILPTRDNLLVRGVTMDPECLVCMLFGIYKPFILALPLALVVWRRLTLIVPPSPQKESTGRSS